ncbi:helix-turn-helix domain-containing protein [Amycolatopsis sp. EV170708-02-1]|uniref:helix-turn-helix domain-containing protein n=1 Tax=Amycolatopsis sp. EV170708-02-1 TaxID=2919322 RepID=UPI001F0C2A83|nr:helix-turn-helix domain-containing protein [Amycolatopsis sp. EV170708-02-1]UMO99620.1 helix-turn-helix domain-containing protein [Amycolatopsis sp. EV170708-02-1]
MATVYRERTAPGGLEGVVRCLWEDAGGAPKRIVPDGCVDLVECDGEVFVAGPDTAPWTWEAGERAHGVRFAPGRASDVLGLGADELRDQRVSLGDLWGKEGELLAERVLSGAASLTDVVARRRAGRADREISELIARLDGGAPRVSAALKRFATGERQLRRRFTLAVGYGPATYLRVSRFQRAIGLSGSAPDLASLAFSAGYADQAHLSRDCREFSGLKASEFFRARK